MANGTSVAIIGWYDLDFPLTLKSHLFNLEQLDPGPMEVSSCEWILNRISPHVYALFRTRLTPVFIHVFFQSIQYHDRENTLVGWSTRCVRQGFGGE